MVRYASLSRYAMEVVRYGKGLRAHLSRGRGGEATEVGWSVEAVIAGHRHVHARGDRLGEAMGSPPVRDHPAVESERIPQVAEGVAIVASVRAVDTVIRAHE